MYTPERVIVQSPKTKFNAKKRRDLKGDTQRAFVEYSKQLRMIRPYIVNLSSCLIYVLHGLCALCV
jgi:hypothetical protein